MPFVLFEYSTLLLLPAGVQSATRHRDAVLVVDLMDWHCCQLQTLADWLAATTISLSFSPGSWPDRTHSWAASWTTEVEHYGWLQNAPPSHTHTHKTQVQQTHSIGATKTSGWPNLRWNSLLDWPVKISILLCIWCPTIIIASVSQNCLLFCCCF